MKKTVQVKHLTDETFFFVLAGLALEQKFVANPLSGRIDTNKLLGVYHSVPEKVVRAKLKNLVRRDLICSECTCGCAPGFYLTTDGIDFIYSLEAIYRD